MNMYLDKRKNHDPLIFYAFKTTEITRIITCFWLTKPFGLFCKIPSTYIWHTWQEYWISTGRIKKKKIKEEKTCQKYFICHVGNLKKKKPTYTVAQNKNFYNQFNNIYNFYIIGNRILIWTLSKKNSWVCLYFMVNYGY